MLQNIAVDWAVKDHVKLKSVLKKIPNIWLWKNHHQLWLQCIHVHWRADTLVIEQFRVYKLTIASHFNFV